MGSSSRSRHRSRRASRGSGPDRDRHPSAVEENVEAIKHWEHTQLLARSPIERFSDWIAARAGGGIVIVLHAVWFAAWLVVNAGLVAAVPPFDPFPFPFLTMTVSLEAIFLALFVLASQNRLARQADMRSHLDLQIDLLAEREMTAVLVLLRDLAGHHGVRTTLTADQLHDLIERTDLRRLTARMEELTNPDGAATAPPAGMHASA
jgi:uncharacterized membrane protein